MIDTITDDVRAQIVLAAASVAAAAAATDDDELDHSTRVALAAAEITSWLDPRSEVSRAITQVANCKVFLASVVAIRKEKSSTRGVVTLHTGTDRSDDGNEEVRTERTDSPIGRAMARRVQTEMIGRKVLVYVEVEPIGGDRKVRVLRHIVDQGPADGQGTTTTSPEASNR